MAIDITKLRPSDLAKSLNSTPLGAVIDERQLYRHRTLAGYRIGDGKRIHLMRYIAWVCDQRLAKRKTTKTETQKYDEAKAYTAARNRSISTLARDIGPIPPVADPDRKAQAQKSFRLFCESYFCNTFLLNWSEDHLRIIQKIESAVLHGGLFAMAMPRGSGKTSLAETATIWAVVCGHRDFVCLIGSDTGHAKSMLESIKVELETNDELLEDFPEIVFPIRALERIHNRANGQTCGGVPTRIKWTADEIVLPTIDGSVAAGAIIRTRGIEARIRGMKAKRPDGTSPRPSLVILDDPQTDESARSPEQINHRMMTLNGAVLGLAGPGKNIAGIMPCTVIQTGDMADQILDRQKYPIWQGERTKMVYAFPANEKLWQRYREIRDESFRADGDGHQATDFYRENQAAMDEGAVVAWPDRYNPNELSAIQHAMNLKFRDEWSFYAEFQNEPLKLLDTSASGIDGKAITTKTNSYARGEVPANAHKLTAFIDIQGVVLFWMVCAWEDGFNGHIIDYGAYPDQGSPYFTLRDVKRTILDESPKSGLEGAIYAALDALCGQLIRRRWARDDGVDMHIERCLIDANWGQSTDVVYMFCRQSAYASVVMPSHGRYVGASSIPFSDYKRKKGEQMGFHWRIPAVQGTRQVRHILVDTNYWKSFIFERLAVSMGDSGCLAVFEPDRQADGHRMLADHLSSESRVQTEGRGRKVDEWRLAKIGADNHWLDCLVGASAAASMLGISLAGMATNHTRRQGSIRLSDLQKNRDRYRG